MSRAAPRHGTTSGYTHDKCRCDACCEANTKRVTEWRQRARQAGPIPRQYAPLLLDEDAQIDGAWCDIPGCDHRRSNRGYDMKPTGKVCADEPHGNNLDRTEQEG